MTPLACPHCGNEIDVRQRRCRSCGVPLQSDPVALELPAFLSPEAPTVTLPEPFGGEPVEPGFDAGCKPQLDAGFALRPMAFMVDFVVLGILGVPFLILTGLLFPEGAEPFGAAWLVFSNLLGWLIAWLYYSAMESSPWMGTIGKRVWGIMVTDMEGKRLTFGRAGQRNFAKVWSILTLGIGFVMAGFSPTKQALHDHIAGTYVVLRHGEIGVGPQLQEQLSRMACNPFWFLDGNGH